METKSPIPVGWRFDLLDNLAKRGSGHTPDKSKSSYWNGGIKWVSLADSSQLDNGYIYTTDKEISEEGLQNSSAVLHPAETVVLSRDAGVGKSAVLATPMAVSQHFMAWQCDNRHTLHSWFLYYWLQMMKPEFERQAVGSTIKTIGLPYFKKLKILAPSYTEQTKIAQILSTWDKAIAITERLLANSQQQKDMLTNQLLNGQKRFSEFVTSQDYQRTSHGSIPSDWGYVSIAEIANQQSKVNSAQSDLPVLSCSKYDGLVDSLKYFKKKVYSDDTSKYRVVEFGDFAYPSNHIEEGSIGYQDLYPAGIVSPIYTVFRTSDAVDDYFLYRTLKTDKYRQIFSAATSASVDRRGSLRWKEFSKIQVPLPSLPEQQKIAQVLSTADTEIANLQAQLDKLKLEKKALMQQLLTGKRRVRLDDEEEDVAPIRRVG